MNALVKKEIRLLLPSWVVAMVLVLPAICTRSDDGRPVFLLFFAMTMMALAAIGRESSLNTFSQLLAQPMERAQIWKTKLTVLSVAFLIVFGVWCLALAFSFKDYGNNPTDPETADMVLVGGCLVLVATFSGGLWAALLLRQIAGAFWLALLVPATLAGFTTAFASISQPDSGVIVALCIILGLYSLGGFLFARWMFFRAQDVGWTGGIITLPELNVFGARSAMARDIRQRRPIIALIKKELRLHRVSFIGAAILLVMHVGIIILRNIHKFSKGSGGEILISIFWLFWLVLPVLIGAMSMAEERRLGVAESQLCLPVSRRVQFFIKGILVLSLGIILGGFMPCLLESVGRADWQHTSDTDPLAVLAVIIGLSLWLSLTSFFASSLAKNFLQAVGFAIAASVCSGLIFPILAQGKFSRLILFEAMPVGSVLPMFIIPPTLAVTLLWLAYLNFKNFREDWYLWRRTFLGLTGAAVFVFLSSAVFYNRAWETFKPLEPAHGAAVLSQANPPTIQVAEGYNLLVRLPDGRVWFDYLNSYDYYYGNSFNLKHVFYTLLHPLPESGGPRQFISGSNWVTATTERVFFGNYRSPTGQIIHSRGYFDSVGIQPDGTLWVSKNSGPDKWTTDALHRFGDETDWKRISQGRNSVLLLKNNGTLWRWGTVTNEWTDWATQWPGLASLKPYQVGTNSDWAELFDLQSHFARKTDGTTWHIETDWKTGQDELKPVPGYDKIIIKTASRAGDNYVAFIGNDGTLQMIVLSWDSKGNLITDRGSSKMGNENDWSAVADGYNMMVALKKDGSLWQWDLADESSSQTTPASPTRLGIHQDWVAINKIYSGVIACAADGSLWLWPDRKYYEYGLVIKLPKQPQYLGNILN